MKIYAASINLIRAREERVAVVTTEPCVDKDWRGWYWKRMISEEVNDSLNIEPGRSIAFLHKIFL